MHATIQDVAKAAKVSLATVDRVLNDRGGVATKSVQKVHRAVTDTGYVRDTAAANLSRSQLYRLIFVLPDTDANFVTDLADAIIQEDRARRHLRFRIVAKRYPSSRPNGAATVLSNVSENDCDGIVLMAREEPAVQFQIARLHRVGVPVVTLVSDLPSSLRQFYVGPNNVEAGCTAGAFMAQFLGSRQGKVYVLAGVDGVRDHLDRRNGFLKALSVRNPQIRTAVGQVSSDDPPHVEELAANALRGGDIVGFYNVGAGNRGLLNALRSADFDARPITILHELSDTTRAGLCDGTIDLVIDQDPAGEVARAIAILRDLIDGRPPDLNAGNIRPQIHILENLPQAHPTL